MTHVFCFMVISRLFPKEIVFRFQHDNFRHGCHMVGKLSEKLFTSMPWKTQGILL